MIRLNIFINTHPQSFFEQLKSEAETKSDGFPQRFLFSAPRPHFYSIKETKKITIPKLALSVVFLVVLRLNIKPIEYVFDVEAQYSYEKKHDEFQEIKRRFVSNHILGYVLFQRLGIFILFLIIEILFY